MDKIELDDIRFYTKPCKKLSQTEIKDSSKLFSENYGVYSNLAPNGKAQKTIKLGESYYQGFVLKEDYYVSFAYHQNQLVGHAYYLLKQTIKGKASWILQLVVHKAYRNLSIGKRLLYSVWGFSNDIAWGLATANPLTVKTLESATLRKVSTDMMAQNIDIIKMLGEDIAFVNNDLITIAPNQSIIYTDFYINHDEIKDLLDIYSDTWALGELPEGHEWLAFTFQDQELIPLNKDKIDKIIEHSDKILKEAYSRMEMPTHKWASYSYGEVKHIIDTLQLTDADIAIADYGCGIGRHANIFFEKGFKNIIGIDFSRSNIEYCNQHYPNLSGHFIEADCRHVALGKKFDLIICLYDVIGSFPDEDDNRRILNNINMHLKKGGFLVLSVMNMELTNFICKYKADIYNSPLSLFKLKASNIMQSSGNIFNPEYFLIDTNSNLVYRKEIFINENHISAEYLIRDRRYTSNEITSLLDECNFSVSKLCFVQAGKWDVSLAATDSKAKEILVFAQKK